MPKITPRLRSGIIQSGARDVRRAAQTLAARIPARLAPLSRVAYNYKWVWHSDGDQLFRDIDPHRWRISRQNPVRFLRETSEDALERAAGNLDLVARAEALREDLEIDLGRPPSDDGIPPEHPVAFFCAEFGLHRSLPVYSGGLGALAGDIIKEASDRALPMVGIGILYRQGYFHQRVDNTGWQQEYWYGTDPDRRPAAKVTGDDGLPITVKVPIWGEDVSVHVWRVDVGRIPLFLLDTELLENTPLQRFISHRLYEGNRQVRIAQYALLGVGGMRVLDALGIEPSVIHLNEGHPALATLELVYREMAAGAPFADACARVRQRVVFTTHTPVPAGNETYSADEMLAVFPHVAKGMGMDWESLIGVGRIHPNDRNEPPGMTPLAIRMSRSVNGVSRIHGRVSRGMWQPMFPGQPAESVPITSVTNGAHLPSWIAPSMRHLLDQYLGPDWHGQQRVTDPATWTAVDKIPDEELWAVRNECADRVIRWAKSQTVTERLTRGDSLDYAHKAARTLDPDVLTIGFARRLAAYKRLHLITYDLGRLLRVLESPRPIQLFFAGKAHPRDQEAKTMLQQQIFRHMPDPKVGGRVAFFEDYDMGIASLMVSGCDVWCNLPRPPLEASGTSGMKAAFNGTLNLSVLDGWWDEAYDGSNGWAIRAIEADAATQDAHDANAFYDLLEKELIPLFYERDQRGIPRGWVARMKASLKTIGPRFCATRMLDEYVRNIYRGR
jgi:starch phosphorylase